MLYRVQGSCLAIRADTKDEAIVKYKTIALSSKTRRYINDVIKDVGFRIEEFDVGDSKTMVVDKKDLLQNYAKILVIYEGIDRYRIGLDIPKSNDEFSTFVVKSDILSEHELTKKLKLVGVKIKNAEREYIDILKAYNKKLKKIIKGI